MSAIISNGNDCLMSKEAINKKSEFEKILILFDEELNFMANTSSKLYNKVNLLNNFTEEVDEKGCAEKEPETIIEKLHAIIKIMNIRNKSIFESTERLEEIVG